MDKFGGGEDRKTVTGPVGRCEGMDRAEFEGDVEGATRVPLHASWIMRVSRIASPPSGLNSLGDSIFKKIHCDKNVFATFVAPTTEQLKNVFSAEVH